MSSKKCNTGYIISFEKMISYHNLYDANTPERLSKVTLNNEKKNILINIINIKIKF